MQLELSEVVLSQYSTDFLATILNFSPSTVPLLADDKAMEKYPHNASGTACSDAVTVLTLSPHPLVSCLAFETLFWLPYRR